MAFRPTHRANASSAFPSARRTADLILNQEKAGNALLIPYYLTLNREVPGKVVLAYMPGGAVRHEVGAAQALPRRAPPKPCLAVRRPSLASPCLALVPREPYPPASHSSTNTQNITVTPEGYLFRVSVSKAVFTSLDQLLSWFKAHALDQPAAAVPAARAGAVYSAPAAVAPYV